MVEVSDRWKISIHALREEGDSPPSTTPKSSANFYPRPPRGGRRGGQLHRPLRRRISIHALREEGDVVANDYVNIANDFYPRPPRGGRRYLQSRVGHSSTISIHALREEGDQGNTAALSVTTIFLSTPSARRATVPPRASFSSSFYFYPRPPRGGRPGQRRRVGSHRLISIHALREEGDREC